MANKIWKGVYPKVFGHTKQLLLNKFFDPSTPSMRKGCDGRKKTGKKRVEITKRMVKIVATTSLPAVDHPNADRWNAARSCQNYCKGGVWQNGILKVLYRMSSSIEGCLPLKVVFIEGPFPFKVIFYCLLSSIEGCLPLKVVFHCMVSSIEG